MVSFATNDEREGILTQPTNLGPEHLRQRADELRGGVKTQLQHLFVDYLADGQPQGRLEPLLIR